MLDNKSDLIDPDPAACGTHASKVCRAASAVVEGDISARMMEDGGRHDQQAGVRNITED